MMRKPHVVLDNHYGKLSGYMDAWENAEVAIPVRNVDDIPQAISAAHKMYNALK
jgi:exopolysaccharide biosynthesis predicted pyruvyltransferase EpsI